MPELVSRGQGFHVFDVFHAFHTFHSFSLTVKAPRSR